MAETPESTVADDEIIVPPHFYEGDSWEDFFKLFEEYCKRSDKNDKRKVLLNNITIRSSRFKRNNLPKDYGKVTEIVKSYGKEEKIKAATAIVEDFNWTEIELISEMFKQLTEKTTIILTIATKTWNNHGLEEFFKENKNDERILNEFQNILETFIKEKKEEYNQNCKKLGKNEIHLYEHIFLNEYKSDNDILHMLNDQHPTLPFKLTCTHVVHFTENKNARDIGLNESYPNYFWFQPQSFEFKLKEGDVPKIIKNLTWFAPLPRDGWDDVYKNHPNSLRVNISDFGKSPAFNGPNFYGPIGFAVPWKIILYKYAESRKTDYKNIDLRIFGAFKYKKEVMYAILVCLKSDNIEEDITKVDFQSIDDDGETIAFIRSPDDDHFIWKNYSTRQFDFWDHVSFAFYYSNNTEKLLISPEYFEIKAKTASRKRTGGKGDRPDYKKPPDYDIVSELLKKTSDAKTAILNTDTPSIFKAETLKKFYHDEINALKSSHEKEIADLKKTYEPDGFKTPYEKRITALQETHVKENAALKKSEEEETAALEREDNASWKWYKKTFYT